MQPNACFAAIGGVRACSFSTSDYFSRTNWCGRQNRRRPQDRCLRSCTPQWGEAAAALVGALPTGPALLCCHTLLFNAQPYCKVLLSTLRMSQCLCHALPCFILVFSMSVFYKFLGILYYIFFHKILFYDIIRF